MRKTSDNRITYLGRTTHRARGIPFGIRRADRRSHVYIVGKTGTGKSTLLLNMILQDLAAGEGLAIFDPHGDLFEAVRASVPKAREQQLVLLGAPGDGLRWTFNPLAGVDREQRPLAAAQLVEVFHKIWPDDWGPRLEHILRNVLYTLLEVPGSTLADIPRLVVDTSFRRQLVGRVENGAVRAFWRDEFERYSWRFRAVVLAPLQNKVGAFLVDPRVRRILAAPESSFDMRRIMDDGGVLLVNLSKGLWGEGPAALLGSLLVSHLALRGLERASVPQASRRDVFVYLDEFQTFATRSLATLFSELRKYHVGMTVAHQFLGQLDPLVRDSVLGNAGTIVAFRVGAKDAALISGELSPVFRGDDLVNLPNYQTYLRLMVGGQVSKPFSAETTDSIRAVPLRS